MKMRCIRNTTHEGLLHPDLTIGKSYSVKSRDQSMDGIDYMIVLGDSGEDVGAPARWFTSLPSVGVPMNEDIVRLGELLRTGEARIIGKITIPEYRWIIVYNKTTYTVPLSLRPSWRKYYRRVK